MTEAGYGAVARISLRLSRKAIEFFLELVAFLLFELKKGIIEDRWESIVDLGHGRRSGKLSDFIISNEVVLIPQYREE